MDTSLVGKISDSVTHPLADTSMLENVKLPLAYVHPFALVFSDGTLHIFWAQSEDEANRWMNALKSLLPEPSTYNPDFANYVLRTKDNVFLISLYIALVRKVEVEEKIEV